jgi:vanillate O-demethylase ferredoxin subunit
MKLLMKMRVRDVREETTRIRSFTLVHHMRPKLPPFAAGAHVAVALPNGLLRHYSLCSDPADLSSYRLAVRCEDDGAGGSRAMHEIRPGDVLYVRYPVNHFGLADGAAFHLLIAGGIGITPMLAMVHSLKARGEPFRLHYLARSRHDMAFVDELQAMCPGDALRLHLSDEAGPTGRLDLATVIADLCEDTHVYCCGPKRLIDGLANVCRDAGRREETMHVERFQGLSEEIGRRGEAFAVRFARSGRTLEVPQHKSLLDVLRDAGVSVESSCEGGVCRSCRTEYVAGEPIHRDLVLGNDERARYLLPCVSRAKGTLILPL